MKHIESPQISILETSLVEEDNKVIVQQRKQSKDIRVIQEKKGHSFISELPKPFYNVHFSGAKPSVSQIYLGTEGSTKET